MKKLPEQKEQYIVWNKSRREGFVTDDYNDARYAAGYSKLPGWQSYLAEIFRENYADEGKLKVEKVFI